MLRYCMAFPLQNEPKHSYVGPAGTEIIYFLSSFEISRTTAKLSQAREVHISQPTPMKSRVVATELVCAARPVSFA